MPWGRTLTGKHLAREHALTRSRNLGAAAARLGMARVSLSRWIGRRKLPMHVEP